MIIERILWHIRMTLHNTINAVSESSCCSRLTIADNLLISSALLTTEHEKSDVREGKEVHVIKSEQKM